MLHNSAVLAAASEQFSQLLHHLHDQSLKVAFSIPKKELEFFDVTSGQISSKKTPLATAPFELLRPQFLSILIDPFFPI